MSCFLCVCLQFSLLKHFRSCTCIGVNVFIFFSKCNLWKMLIWAADDMTGYCISFSRGSFCFDRLFENMMFFIVFLFDLYIDDDNEWYAIENKWIEWRRTEKHQLKDWQILIMGSLILYIVMELIFVIVWHNGVMLGW